MMIMREPPAHYAALHQAEAAYRDGDMQTARWLFGMACREAASISAKLHCRSRRLSALSQDWIKPQWHYLSFSDVVLGYDAYGKRCEISANMVMLYDQSQKAFREQFRKSEAVYEPMPNLGPDEYDPEICHSTITVYGRTFFEARRRLIEVDAFLLELVRAGDVDDMDCSPTYRLGDRRLLAAIEKKQRL